MTGLVWWQGLLNGLGWVLSHIYDGVHSYGLAIIILTLGIRLVLLPLGLKQIRSMQSMQALQPQIKSLQQKYKGNKQKLNEEMMKLYKERGVNPLAGCWPMLVQIPILIALYSVLRFPQSPPHLPKDSVLETKIECATGAATCPDPSRRLNPQNPDAFHAENPSRFLGMNLLCNAGEAGKPVNVRATRSSTAPVAGKLDCGNGFPVRIPYYVLAALMIGTMYYQQRQMQRAAPPGASQQQQALTRIMPLISIFWGFIVPSGVILYWTTSNAVQIGQQYFLLRAGKIGPGTAAGGDGARRGDGKAASGGRGRTPGRAQSPAPRTAARTPAPARRGFFASMLERAEEERARRQGQTPPASAEKSQAQTSEPDPDPAPSAEGRSNSGGQTGSQGPRPQQRPGGQGARSRKKRRKR